MAKIDIHSHILYGVDDGSKSIISSIQIIKEQVKLGFTDIILTPHYIENSKYRVNNSEKKYLLNTLKEELKREDIDVNLYLGNEVYINDNILNLIDNDEICLLNNSKYLLIELPMFLEFNNALNVIYELKEHGIIPILAHPERYDFIQKDVTRINEFYEAGCLFQANYGSIIGIYGKNSKKTLKKLLKLGYIDFLGTDVHFPDNKIYNNMDKIIKRITKLVGEDKFNDLVFNNPNKVLNNKEF